MPVQPGEEHKTVTVTVDRGPSGTTGRNAGYQISVEPWLLWPDDPNNELGSITWNFNTLNGLKFGEITVNFKTKKHFDPIDQDGSDFVLRDTSSPALSKTIDGAFDPNFNFIKKNYNYILEFTLVDPVPDEVGGDPKEIEIELDPGYRVKP